MAGGSNLTDVQALNVRTVFDTVRLEGPISRAEIGRRLDLAVPTISNIVRSLLDKGLLQEARAHAAGRGKPPVDLRVNPDAGYAVGLNVDRDRLVGVLVDLEGRSRHRVDVALSRAHPDEVLPRLATMHAELLHASGVPAERLWGTGLSVPGPLHVPGLHLEAPGELFELPGWKGVDLHAAAKRTFAGPTVVENDAVAAAIGEAWWGEGRRLHSFFFVYFGLYLGGAAVVNGTVNRGYAGFANEFGSIPVPEFGRGAPRYAPLGTQVSLAALRAHLENAGRPVRDADDLTRHVHDGDPALEGWLDATAERLAPVLATIDGLFDPEAILFGERFPEPLVHDLIARLEQRLPDFAVPYKPRTPRLLRGWVGDDAAAKGAATLPLYRALHPDVFVQEAIGGSRKGGDLPTIP